MDVAEFRHMITHAGPVGTHGRWVLWSIIPVCIVSDDQIEIRPPYLTSVKVIMDQAGFKTARTVNKHLDSLVAEG